MLNRPSVEEIAKNRDLNRYEVVVAVAKGARLATEEYIEVREAAERSISNHETDKSLQALLGPEYKDQKPVKVAINRLISGDYAIEKLNGSAIDEDAEAEEEAAE